MCQKCFHDYCSNGCKKCQAIRSSCSIKVLFKANFLYRTWFHAHGFVLLLLTSVPVFELNIHRLLVAPLTFWGCSWSWQESWGRGSGTLWCPSPSGRRSRCRRWSHCAPAARDVGHLRLVMFPGETSKSENVRMKWKLWWATHFVEDSIVEAVEILVDFFLQDVVEVLHLRPWCVRIIWLHQ